MNPRPVDDEYVKYSFPSKNMEYMASGTSTLLTAIPSMPESYYPFVHLIPDNSVEHLKMGIQEAYRRWIHGESDSVAECASRFILENKTPQVQVARALRELGIKESGQSN